MTGQAVLTKRLPQATFTAWPIRDRGAPSWLFDALWGDVIVAQKVVGS